jgi:Mg2+/citrate symporter
MITSCFTDKQRHNDNDLCYLSATPDVIIVYVYLLEAQDVIIVCLFTSNTRYYHCMCLYTSNTSHYHCIDKHTMTMSCVTGKNTHNENVLCYW